MIGQRLAPILSLCLLFVVYTLSGCDGAETTGPLSAHAHPGHIEYCGVEGSPEPLTVLVDSEGKSEYCGEQRGLYNDAMGMGTNTMPPAHEALGLQQAGQIPTDEQIVLLSIGMSNVTQEWCHNSHSGAPSQFPPQDCNDWSFMGQANDPEASHTLNSNLVIVNGASGGQEISRWECESSSAACENNYARVEEILTTFEATPEQVQVVWIKGNLGDSACRTSMGGQAALDSLYHRCTPPPPGPPPYPNEIDAIGAEMALGHVMRELKDRYPNLKLAFISSRIYGGWNNTLFPTTGKYSGSPEPYAFETGFAVKRLIDAQIRQLEGGGLPDQEAGDLSLFEAPWIAWGPYLWDTEDFWKENLFSSDGTHPSPPDHLGRETPCITSGTLNCGEGKVASKLLTFFQTSIHTDGWFLE